MTYIYAEQRRFGDLGPMPENTDTASFGDFFATHRDKIDRDTKMVAVLFKDGSFRYEIGDRRRVSPLFLRTKEEEVKGEVVADIWVEDMPALGGRPLTVLVETQYELANNSLIDEMLVPVFGNEVNYVPRYSAEIQLRMMN